MTDDEPSVSAIDAPPGSGSIAYGCCWRAPDGSEGVFVQEGSNEGRAYWQKELAQAWLDKIEPDALPAGYTTFIKEISVMRTS